MKISVMILVVLCTVSCGDRLHDNVVDQEKIEDPGFEITSFESSYGDGHTPGISYSHDLHYDRDSGNVIITKSAYMADPNHVHLTVSADKKRQIDNALNSIDMATIKDLYLNEDGFAASSGDGLSMSIVLSDGYAFKTVSVDTNYPEKLPAGLYFIFMTSLSEGRWFREP